MFKRYLLPLCAALIVSACGDHDEPAAPTTAAAPVTNIPGTSDVQQWAAQQTGSVAPSSLPTSLATSLPASSASAPVKDALLPPVIHEVE